MKPASVLLREVDYIVDRATQFDMRVVSHPRPARVLLHAEAREGTPARIVERLLAMPSSTPLPAASPSTPS